MGGNKMPLVIIGVVVVLVIGGFIGMNVLNKNTQPTNDSMMTEETSASPSPETSGDTMTEDTDVKTITMEAGAFYYSVKEITVKKGEKVKIVMNSVDMMHDINIDELNVHSTIAKAGETATVEFTADKLGTFEYYCSVGQHRQQGQVGKITVTE